MNNKPRGRPKKDVVMSSAERMRRYRARQYFKQQQVLKELLQLMKEPNVPN